MRKHSIVVFSMICCLVIFKIAPVKGVSILHKFASYSDTVKQDSGIISVNQSGYNLDLPKRFTAPLAPDGTPFVVTTTKSDRPLFTGIIHNGIGDFSLFNPINIADQFVVKLTTGQAQLMSYPFSISKYWLQNAFIQSSLDFMIDDRSVIGSHPSAYGGCPWRDGAYYTFEVPSLIMQYMSNPAAYADLPVQINYYKEKERVLSPGFRYVMDVEGQSARDVTRRYYTELDAPVGTNVPDIVQLIHWGIGFYMLNPVTLDPSGDSEGRRLHAQTLEQFAFFLYGYPLYKKYFTERYYQQARDLAFKQWSDAGLFDVFTAIGTGKGRECPGHSILPNLLMYEVAKREGYKNSERFFNAAFKQTEWVINNVDWNDPRTTKGQRMSEHKLITSLVYFLMHYPDKTPSELKKKITDWSNIVIARSENYWDFRRYDLGTNWSIPEYSESGNIAGLPASILAAASVDTNKIRVARLEQIAIAAVDDLFGRNPQNACAPHHFTLGFQNLEKGWPKAYVSNVCARLETVRGAISSTCSTEMYPYHPDGKFRHPEGWTAFNSAWNVGLAYLTWYNTELKLTDENFQKTIKHFKSTDQVYVQLSMPGKGTEGKKREIRLMFDDKRVQTIYLQESTPGSQLFRARFSLKNIGKSLSVTLVYGEGIFEKSIRIDKTALEYAVKG